MTEPSTAFPPDVLDLFERTREVDIETRDADGARPEPPARHQRRHHRRRLEPGRHRQQHGERDQREEAPASGRRIGVRVVPATDPTSVEACSRGLASKYAGDPATPSMVMPAILDTTLRLEPR